MDFSAPRFRASPDSAVDTALPHRRFSMAARGRRQIGAVWQFLAVLLVTLLLVPMAHAQSVQAGLDLYTVKCVGCHTSPANTVGTTAINHRLASNNPSKIRNAITNNLGGMGLVGNGLTTLTDRDLLSLALYIGQFKTPAFTVANGNAALNMKVAAGQPSNKDIYPTVLADGNGGAAQDGATGLPTTSAARGTAGSSQTTTGSTAGAPLIQYNVTYTHTAASLVQDTFDISIASAFSSANSTSPSRAIVVDIFGLTSGASAQALKGRAYSAGAPLYTLTASIGAGATGFSATGLPGTMTIDASGRIIGTSNTTGTVTATLTATMANAVDSPTKTVSKNVDITTAGITSGATVSFPQNQPIGANFYQIASNVAINANSFTLSSLPDGLAFSTSTGRITGTPTISGDFDVTVGATATNGDVMTQGLRITVTSAGAPAITTNLPSSPIVAGTVGTSINGANYRIIASNPPISSYSAVAAPGSVLPDGILFDTGTGLITGTPTTSGDFNLLLGASNAAPGTPLAVTIRFNPTAAPAITSGDPAPVNLLGNFDYSIVASNGPISSYAVAAPGVLPPGLQMLDNTTGRITGTPTTSGIFKASVTATNVVNLTSQPRELTFTINPTSAPVVTSPTFASLVAGVQITPIQIVATNPAILAYAATGLPPGLEMLDPASGIITGTPTTPGTYSASLSARNAVDFGPVRAVAFNVGVPAPTACAMSVPLNTPTTLDLATCLFNGFAPTGVSVVATPAHGAAVATGTRVTYTPVHNYFGADSFTFVGNGAGGTSPQGTVTVTVTGRPDPTQDPIVTALLAAQAETAQRFSRAQIANFQRRMESLHRGAADTGAGAPALQGQAAAAQAAGLAAGTVFSASANAAMAPTPAVASTPMGTTLIGRSFGGSTEQRDAGNGVGRADIRPGELSGAQALDVVAGGLGLKSLPFSDSVVSLIKSRSVNLAGVGSGLGLNTTSNVPGATSYWIEGVASFGTRDASGASSGAEFSSNGITVGVDRRFSEQLAAGMGLGYARDTTRIGGDGSINRTKGYSLAVYGSYQPGPNTFVDALLGIGSLDFDSTRFVAPISDYAYGKRGGTQVFGSLTGGYEFRDQSLLVSPYGRIDFSTDRLRTSTETGAGAYALTYFGHTSTSVQGALGVRGESVFATRFGYAVPKLRAEYRHEFQGTGQAVIGYADQPGGTRYALASTRGARDAIVFGIGSDFLLRDGLTLSLEYQLSHSFSNESSYALRVRLSKDFDVRGMPKLFKEFPQRTGEPLNLQVDAGYTHDDNVTRAKAGPDKLSDDFYSVNVSKSIEQQLSEQSRLLWTGTLGGEKFHHFNGLSHVTASAEAEYQYRDSSEFSDPTLGAFAKLSGEAFETRLRDGYRMSVGVSVRQPLTDRINLFGALSHNRRYANSEVFSTRDNSVRANIDYALSGNETLYFGAEYRRGDIVSTGRASLENVSIAKVFAQDDAYAGGQFFSYKVGGNTVLTTLGYNLVLGSHDSIDFSWRYVRSTPGLRPAWVTSPRSYKANQLSAVYLLRF